MKFKTGEPVTDATMPPALENDEQPPALENDEQPPALENDEQPLYVATVHRAFGAPSVYFGTFVSLDALKSWCDTHGLAVSILELTDPNSDPDTWWFKPR